MACLLAFWKPGDSSDPFRYAPAAHGVIKVIQDRIAAGARNKRLHRPDRSLDGHPGSSALCGEDGQYECKESSNGKAYFVLKAKNHQVIGQSQMYESESGCANGIASVQENGGSSEITDLTEG